jgi:hypothetical protein
MAKNVLLPIPLVKQIIELLGCWDISNYDRAIRDAYCDIVQSLDVKMRKLELHDAYSKIIAAGNEVSRHDARINYLWQKALLSDMSADNRIT